MIAFGFVAFAVADSGFTYQTATGAYGSGSLIDIGWFLCFALILVAALRPTEEDATGSAPKTRATARSACSYRTRPSSSLC